MTKKTWPTTISGKRCLEKIGINLKLARLKRNLTMSEIAERAGINVKTLREIESGGDKVKIGSYVNVLVVLNLLYTLEKVAEDDSYGSDLINSQLLGYGRVRRRRYKIKAV